MVIWIYMNGEKVASLTRSSGGKLELQYCEQWLNSENRRPLSLSLPLVAGKLVGEKVHNFFDNLLPDSEAIRRRIQGRFKTKSSDTFDLLYHIGRDCVGALQLMPEEVDHVDVRKMEGRELSETDIAEILSEYQSNPLGMTEGEDFRISIAGAQEKTALLRVDNKWLLPHGMTPTTHIFKLPIGKNSRFDLSDSVENEWLCHLILKAFLIPVADAEIGTFQNTKALIVTRFDRRFSRDQSWIIRLPQEDFCQALGFPPGLKYENQGGPGIVDIMQVLLGSSDNLLDRKTFLKTQFVFWLLAAIDGHAKNFSIFLEAQGRYRLTPMYDVLSAHSLLAKGQFSPKRIKMAMALRGKNVHYHWERIKVRHWLSTAKACGFPEDEMKQIMYDTASEVNDVIEKVQGQIKNTLVQEVADSVFEGMVASQKILYSEI
jgi:serine/threonine-protein kinase HipA